MGQSTKLVVCMVENDNVAGIGSGSLLLSFYQLSNKLGQSIVNSISDAQE